MLYDKEFKVLKELPKLIFEKVGDNYPEYFVAYEEDNELTFYIIDDNFGQPSPANWCNTPYAIKLRERSSKILQRLLNEGYIQIK